MAYTLLLRIVVPLLALGLVILLGYLFFQWMNGGPSNRQ